MEISRDSEENREDNDFDEKCLRKWEENISPNVGCGLGVTADLVFVAFVVFAS